MWLALLIAVAKPEVDVIPAVDGLGFSATVRGPIAVPFAKVDSIVKDPLTFPSWIPAMKEIKREGDTKVYAVRWELPWPVGEVKQRLLFESSKEGPDDIYSWKQVSGGMDRHDGMFRIRPSHEGTYAEYVSAIALRIWIPEWLLRKLQQRAMPSFIRRLGERAAKVP